MSQPQKLEDHIDDPAQVLIPRDDPMNENMVDKGTIGSVAREGQCLETELDVINDGMDTHPSCTETSNILELESICTISEDANSTSSVSSECNIAVGGAVPKSLPDMIGNAIGKPPVRQTHSTLSEGMAKKPTPKLRHSASVDCHCQYNPPDNIFLPEAWVRALSKARHPEKCNANQSSLTSTLGDLIIWLLLHLLQKVETVQNKDVKTAQDVLNTAEEYLCDIERPSYREAAVKELRKAKSAAELGYNGTDDVMAMIHATRIICIAGMYYKYLMGLKESVFVECDRRLKKLHCLDQVKCAFATVCNYPSSSLFAALSAPTQLQREIVQAVCTMNDLIFQLLFSAELISSPDDWPKIDKHCPFVLAYDGKLLEKPEPHLVSIRPSKGELTGFVEIVSMAGEVRLISQNARFVVKANLGVQDEVEFIEGLTSGKTERLTDDCQKVHFAIDSSDQIYMFSPKAIGFTCNPNESQTYSCSLPSDESQMHTDSPQNDTQRPSGTLQIEESQLPSVNQQFVDSQKFSGSVHSIAVGTESRTVLRIDDQLPIVFHGHRGDPGAPYAIHMVSSGKTVTFVVTSRCGAWLVMVDCESRKVVQRVPLEIPLEVLPLQKKQCCIHGEFFFLQHINPKWKPLNPDLSQVTSKEQRYSRAAMTEHKEFLPGLYKFDMTKEAHIKCNASKEYISKHSGRLVSIDSSQLLLQELRCNDPYAKFKELALVNADTLEPIMKWKSPSGSINGCLRGCMSPDGVVAVILDENNMAIINIHTKQFLYMREGLRTNDLTPSAMCWYGERHVLVSHANTVEVHKIPIRM